MHHPAARPRRLSTSQHAVLERLTAAIEQAVLHGLHADLPHVSVEQLSVAFDVGLPVTICAVDRLLRKGSLEVAGDPSSVQELRSAEGSPAARAEHALREWIATGEYRSGSPLPPQRTLPQALKVGGTAVQTALGTLASEGWLNRRPHRPAIVALPDHDGRTVRAGTGGDARPAPTRTSEFQAARIARIRSTAQTPGR